MPHFTKTPVEGERVRHNISDVDDHVFVALIAGLTLVYVGAFFYFLQATMIREPFTDMLAYIDDYLAFRKNGGLWTYLWSPHNQHRLLWTRLTTAVDIELFKGITYPFVVFTTACLIMAALIVQREAAKYLTLPAPKIAGGLLAIMLVLTVANAVDCSLPFANDYPHTVAFVVLSLVLFSGDDSNGTRGIVSWGAAILAGIGAAFGTATGLIIWPILVWIAWRRQLHWRWLLATAGVGTAFIALYVHGVPIPKSTAEAINGRSEFYAPAHLYKIGTYFLTYLGLPWTRSATLAPVGRAIGTILFIVSILVVVQRGIVRSPAGRLERLSIGLIMFTLGTAVLAAVGRVDQEPAVEVPVRYSVFLVPLHVGLLFLALPWLNRLWHDPGYRRTCKAALFLLFALLVVQQIQAGRAAVRTTDAIRVTIDKFLSGERQPEMAALMGNLDNAERIVNLMRENEIYNVKR